MMKKPQQSEKRPRHYAHEIIGLKSIEDRRAALQQVPEDIRPMVKIHVESYFMRRGKRNGGVK